MKERVTVPKMSDEERAAIWEKVTRFEVGPNSPGWAIAAALCGLFWSFRSMVLAAHVFDEYADFYDADRASLWHHLNEGCEGDWKCFSHGWQQRRACR